ASQSIKHYLAALAAFCRWCVHRDYLPIDPLARRTPVQVIPRRKRRALTSDERRRLLEHCAPSHRLLYETAMETGLRANELRQLSLEHLDIDRRRLRLDAAWTKNRQAGWQPISPDLFSCLYAAAGSGEPLEAYRRVRSTLPLPVQPLL